MADEKMEVEATKTVSTEEQPTEVQPAKTTSTEEAHEADGDVTMLAEEGKKNSEWAISNVGRFKASETIDKEGMPEIWLWSRQPNETEGVGTITVENVTREDMYNPFLYGAIQNASQVSYAYHLNKPTDAKLWDGNILRGGTLILYYKNDFTSMHMISNFLTFVRTPSRTLIIKRSIRARGTKDRQEVIREKVEMKGTVIEIPLAMRSLVLRGIPGECTIAQVCKALNIKETDLERHELRKDGRGAPSALITFKDVKMCISTHAVATNVKFDAAQETPTPIYYMAAGVFYEHLQHYLELDEKKIDGKYFVAMNNTQFKTERPATFPAKGKSGGGTTAAKSQGSKPQARKFAGDEGSTPAKRSRATPSKQTSTATKQPVRRTARQSTIQPAKAVRVAEGGTPAAALASRASKPREVATTRGGKRRSAVAAQTGGNMSRATNARQSTGGIVSRGMTSNRRGSFPQRSAVNRNAQQQQSIGRQGRQMQQQPVNNDNRRSQSFGRSPQRMQQQSNNQGDDVFANGKTLAYQNTLLKQQTMIQALQQQVQQQQQSIGQSVGGLSSSQNTNWGYNPSSTTGSGWGSAGSSSTFGIPQQRYSTRSTSSGFNSSFGGNNSLGQRRY